MNQEVLNSLFHYSDGLIFWKVKTAPCVIIGQRAGTHNLDNYRTVRVYKKPVKEHRIIWVMHFGPIPEGLKIDHEDGNTLNNKIDNLRLATNSQNSHNQKKHSRNTSGFKGVHFHKNNKVWEASIGVNGKLKHLGSFKSAESASEAYKLAAKQYHGEFANY